MSSEDLSDEMLTKRMDLVSVPLPINEETLRMDSRGQLSVSVNQDSIPTRHAPAQNLSQTQNSILRPLGYLPPGSIILQDCIVISTHHNHESARAGLFECQAPEGQVMVKIAASEYPPQYDLWQKLVHLQHPNVLRTFRIQEEKGLFFEVQEFCSGGTLADIVPLAGTERPIPSTDWVENSLVPAFHAGIRYLHGQNIIHRDIKPSNLYLRENNGHKTLVVGDFDISSVLQTGRTSRVTERTEGTWIYSAPESLPRFMDENVSLRGASIARSCDYYSFGVVLVELLAGTTSLHQARFPEISDFYLQGGRVEIPTGLSSRLTELLCGLLCRNRQKRWGDEQVVRWLANQTTEEDRRAIDEDRGFQMGRSISAFNSFELSRPTNLQELLTAIIQEPKIALEELMAGDVLLNWIGQLDARIARQIRQDREKWRHHPRLALLCARLRLNPNAPLPITANYKVNSAEEWATVTQTAIARKITSAEKLCHREALLELETWLRMKATPESEAADRVVQIAAHHGLVEDTKNDCSACAPMFEVVSNFQLVLEELCYAFLPEKPYIIAPNIVCQSPQQIVQRTLGKDEDWGIKPTTVYLSSIKRWQDGFLEAYLRQRLVSPSGVVSPILQQMQKVRNDFVGKPFVPFELILRLLDPEMPPIQVELDQKPLQDVIGVPYGGTTTVSIQYRTKSKGMPFAALRLESQSEAVALENYQINVREGEITMKLHAPRDVTVGREYSATLELEGRTTKLVNEPISFRYRITYPVSLTFKKIGIGALMGAGLLGGTRLILTLVVPQALQFEHVPLLARGTWFILFLVLILAIYIAFRLWFWAMVKHTR